MEAEEFAYYFKHHEFMPESMKSAKNVVHDDTIERPARKISMTDGYAAEKAQQAEKAEENTENAEKSEPDPSDDPENKDE